MIIHIPAHKISREDQLRPIFYRSRFKYLPRKRHPLCKGTSLQNWCVEVLNLVRNSRNWKKHSIPFSKTKVGRMRRQERRIVRRMKEA